MLALVSISPPTNPTTQLINQAKQYLMYNQNLDQLLDQQPTSNPTQLNSTQLNLTPNIT